MEIRGCKWRVSYQGENTVINQVAAGRQTQQQESNAGRTVREA